MTIGSVFNLFFFIANDTKSNIKEIKPVSWDRLV